MDRAIALGHYDALIGTIRGIERKGDTVPYTSLNGHMFSALHKDGTVALRLPEPERAAFLKKYRTTLAAHYGVVQPEYVVVPDALLAETSELKPLFAASYTYAATLKPRTAAKDRGAKKKRS